MSLPTHILNSRTRKHALLIGFTSLMLILGGCSGDDVDKFTVNADNTVNLTPDIANQLGGGFSGPIYMVDLRWTAPSTTENGTPLKLSDILHYRIYQRSTDGNVVSTDVPGNTTRIGIPVQTKGTYTYTITAIDINGQESDASTPIVAQVQ